MMQFHNGCFSVWDMIERMGVRIRSEDVADRYGDEAVKSVII